MSPAAARLLRKLEGAWSSETATVWTPANPAFGQCSVSALVVQDHLGGTLRKTRVGEAWHFYNWIDGRRLDTTADQFPSPIAYDDLPATRDEALADTSQVQYEALRQAVSVSPTVLNASDREP